MYTYLCIYICKYTYTLFICIHTYTLNGHYCISTTSKTIAWWKARLKTRWTLQKLPDHKCRLHKLKFQWFFIGPQPWDTPKNCQRKPNNLPLLVLNPEFASCSLVILWYGKPVIPWSSIFSVARQQASLSSSRFPDRLRGPRSRSGIAFSLFTADVPKSQGTPHVECQWCDFCLKNGKISEYHKNCTFIIADLIGFDWEMCIWVHFFWKCHACFEQNPERGKLWQLVKHGWIRQMFIWVATLSCSCSRPTKNCISKTSPG